MQIAQGEKYITFFAAVFDPVKRTLEYVNCGHNPPLFVDPSGRDTLLEDGCVGLGMFRDIPSMNVGPSQCLWAVCCAATPMALSSKRTTSKSPLAPTACWDFCSLATKAKPSRPSTRRLWLR